MNWNYEHDFYNMYNHLGLNEQLDILNKNYPIGSLFHYKQPNKPLSTKDYDKYVCRVEDYVLRQAGHNGMSWYILRVTNINTSTINIRGGFSIEEIHPGSFRPHVSFLRNKKLELLLD